MYVIFPAHELFELYDLYSNASLRLSTTLTMAREYHLCQLKHPSFSSTLKMHNVFAVNLVKIVADFTQQLATIHEQQAEELQLLVETFRKRNAELRRERPLYQSTLFTSWETFLQEVEIDSQIHSDIASTLGRQVSIPLLDRTFHQKVQSRKVFTHRESYETILSKTEDLLLKCHNDYSAAYQRLLTDQSSTNMAAYYDAHNAYVQQLHAANAMIDAYHSDVLPQLMQELEEIYLDLSEVVTKSILDGADVISHKAQEQHSRYDALLTLSKNVSPKMDINNYVRTLGVEKVPPVNNIHPFTPPQLDADVTDIPDVQYIPMLGDEVMVDRNTLPAMRSTYDGLRKEIGELELKIRQIQEALESLLRLQARSLESCLYNKANELQEDICMKRFDLRMAIVHSSAVRAQIELLACKVDERAENSRDRKNSAASTGSMKNKWLKAFKNLKTGGDSSSKKNDKKDGKIDMSPPPLENSHIFQEYTYKKITACDICREILRGHTRQGLRCKMCKTNVHAMCQEKVGKCNPKSRLLRRQKSTSEIESRMAEAADDSMYFRRGPVSAPSGFH